MSTRTVFTPNERAELDCRHRIDVAAAATTWPLHRQGRHRVVERTLAWLLRYRVYLKEYEALTCNSAGSLKKFLI